MHIGGDPSGDWWREAVETDEWGTVVTAKNARLTALAGFTTVRDAGDNIRAINAVRQGIAKGWFEGPRIIAAGAPLSTVGGHGDVHGFRRLGMWPPRPAGPNQFPALLALAACGMLFVVLPSIYAVGAAVAPNVFVRPQPGANPPVMTAFVIIWWLEVILIVRFWNRLRERLSARRPC